jgi:hypothetical protein
MPQPYILNPKRYQNQEEDWGEEDQPTAEQRILTKGFCKVDIEDEEREDVD